MFCTAPAFSPYCSVSFFFFQPAIHSAPPQPIAEVSVRPAHSSVFVLSPVPGVSSCNVFVIVILPPFATTFLYLMKSRFLNLAAF